MKISIVLPAKNESAAIGQTLQKLRMQCANAEIIVVNDGSTDDTAAVAQAAGARVVHHPYSKGNGAAIKTGARAATGEVIVFMDADGQHDPADIPRLLDKLNNGHDMVVGARQKGSQASLGRGFANGLYNRLASWMTGHKVEDLTSGAGQQVPGVSLSAAQRFFLPHHQHHGVFPCWIFSRLHPHPRSQTHRQKPHPPAARRHAVFAHHLQDWHAVFTAEDFCARGFCHVFIRQRLVRLDLGT